MFGIYIFFSIRILCTTRSDAIAEFGTTFPTSSTTLTTSAIEMYCKISSKLVCVSEFSLKYHICIQLLE